MQITVERADYERLVEIFADHPDFRTEERRWRLVDEAFATVARGDAATGTLELGGTARNAAVALVGRFLSFGCLGQRHSLALVLEALRSRVGDDLRTEPDRLIALLDASCAQIGAGAVTTGRSASILHLSDLHLGSLADAENFRSQLAEDLNRELRCTRLDGLICSGDLTLVSSEDEYDAAVAFIEGIKAEFGLTPESIVLVPGNHDLSWPLSRAAYDPGDPALYPAADVQGQRCWIVDRIDYRVRDEARYRLRFQPFDQRCYQPVTGHPYPSDYAQQFRFHHWPDLNILILGLNSAWEIDHHHRDRAGVHPLAVSNALNALRARPDWAGCLKVAVWHHPLASGEPSRILDHGFVERLAVAGFRLALHGHIHKAETGQYHYDQTPGGRRLDILAAGTFGAPSRQWAPGYPLQYQLLRLASGRATVETRRREEPNGAWKPDARWLQGPGRDPVARYPVTL